MKLFIARLFAIILIAVSIIDACAWSGPGYMTVAAIAYRDLSPVERQKLDAILESLGGRISPNRQKRNPIG